MYNQSARTRLRDKLDYEQWVLDEIEQEHKVFPREVGSTLIENGEISAQEICATGLTISQPRVNEIIQRLYPLVFTASYKCIDMIIEWILEENKGKTSHNWRFNDKISDANLGFKQGVLELPQPFANHRDVFEQILEIYTKLVDYRHAVIHRNQFQVENSEFRVENRNGNRYRFDTEELFSLAKIGSVSSDILLNNSVKETQERSLKRYLDNLSFIHGLNTFDIAPDWAKVIEYRVEKQENDSDAWKIDLDIVQQADGSTSTQGYQLEVVGIEDGEVVCEWLIPSEDVPSQSSFKLSENESEFKEYRK